ncbi:MAG TPA: amidohydrolase family protein [Acidimicrobiales bacterium]|nr:amidohydrolase family protein [Acidimicrobiales bacterium]
MTSIAASAVVTPTGVVSPGVVHVDGDRIAGVEAWAGTAPDRTIVPGYVDLQVNGHDDVDCWTASGAQWERMDELLLAQGVTGWCPTLVTAPLHSYGAPLERIAAAGARPGPRPAIAGVHLEGPFLGSRPGAHNRRHVLEPDLDWLAGLPSVVRVVTIGVESPAALDAVRLLAGRGVLVSMGHTAPDAATAAAAADAGVRMATHLFNAMGPLHHRDPGVAGIALTDPRVVPGLIADLVHVHPTAVLLAFLARRGAGVVLVTDAVAWRAEPVRARGVTREGSDAPRRPDGTIAGSALTMDRAVANVVGCGVGLVEAVHAASTAPAELIGWHDRGRLEAGARADLVVLDGELRPVETWVSGTAAWRR